MFTLVSPIVQVYVAPPVAEAPRVAEPVRPRAGPVGDERDAAAQARLERAWLAMVAEGMLYRLAQQRSPTEILILPQGESRPARAGYPSSTTSSSPSGSLIDTIV